VQVLQVISSVAQVLSPLLYGAFIVVIWFQLRAARDSLREVRQEFLAGGRPVVAVHDEFDHATRTLLPGAEYWNTWDIQPAVYEGLRAPDRPRRHAADQDGTREPAATSSAATDTT
jgi:hypothetical protein